MIIELNYRFNAYNTFIISYIFQQNMESQQGTLSEKKGLSNQISQKNSSSVPKKLNFTIDMNIPVTKDHFTFHEKTKIYERTKHTIAQIVSVEEIPAEGITYFDIQLIRSDWFAIGIINKYKRNGQWNSDGKGGIYLKSNGAVWADGMYIHDNPGYKQGDVIRTTVDTNDRKISWKVKNSTLKKVSIPEHFFKQPLYIVIVARRINDQFKIC